MHLDHRSVLQRTRRQKATGRSLDYRVDRAARFRGVNRGQHAAAGNFIGTQVGKIQRGARSGKGHFERLIVTLNGANTGTKVLWLSRNRFPAREPATRQGTGDDRPSATHSKDAINKQTRLSAVARGRDAGRHSPKGLFQLVQTGRYPGGGFHNRHFA